MVTMSGDICEICRGSLLRSGREYAPRIMKDSEVRAASARSTNSGWHS